MLSTGRICSKQIPIFLSCHSKFSLTAEIAQVAQLGLFPMPGSGRETGSRLRKAPPLHHGLRRSRGSSPKENSGVPPECRHGWHTKSKSIYQVADSTAEALWFYLPIRWRSSCLLTFRSIFYFLYKIAGRSVQVFLIVCFLSHSSAQFPCLLSQK